MLSHRPDTRTAQFYSARGGGYNTLEISRHTARNSTKREAYAIYS
ncbi:MAG: hypothetical protein RJA98_3883 [Pseudomonadota bacterium]|jgi:hypothetical protein